MYAVKGLAKIKRKQMRLQGLEALLLGRKSVGKSRSAIITSARYASGIYTTPGESTTIKVCRFTTQYQLMQTKNFGSKTATSSHFA